MTVGRVGRTRFRVHDPLRGHCGDCPGGSNPTATVPPGPPPPVACDDPFTELNMGVLTGAPTVRQVFEVAATGRVGLIGYTGSLSGGTTNVSFTDPPFTSRTVRALSGIGPNTGALGPIGTVDPDTGDLFVVVVEGTGASKHAWVRIYRWLGTDWALSPDVTVQLSSVAAGDNMPVAIARSGGGAWMVVWYRDSAHLEWSRSLDGGLTWSAQASIPGINGTSVSAGSTGRLFGADDYIVFLMASDNRLRAWIYTVATNTWSGIILSRLQYHDGFYIFTYQVIWGAFWDPVSLRLAVVDWPSVATYDETRLHLRQYQVSPSALTLISDTTVGTQRLIGNGAALTWWVDRWVVAYAGANESVPITLATAPLAGTPWTLAIPPIGVGGTPVWPAFPVLDRRCPAGPALEYYYDGTGANLVERLLRVTPP